MICLIPTAGRGLRARPKTDSIAKGMLPIKGKPILQHSLELVRDQLGIDTIVMVIGFLGETIADYFGDGRNFGVSIRYVRNNRLDKGMAWSIFLGRKYISDTFLVVLGDEYYQHSNHHLLKNVDMTDTLAICGTRWSPDKTEIAKNYAVHCFGNRIIKLIEKPRVAEGEWMGTGTFLLSPDILQVIEDCFLHYPGRTYHFIEMLDEAARQGKKIRKFDLQGDYVNINDIEALQYANGLAERS